MTYAATLEKVNEGLVLLLFYSLGMGLPFFLAAFFINHFFRFFDRIKQHMGLIEKISGLILVIVGLLIFFNKLILIPEYLSFLNGFVL